MKKILFIIIAAVTVAAAALFSVRSLAGADPDYFEENVEALSDDEGGSISICFNSYSFSFIHRVLRCGTCDWAWGIGDSQGGYCIK